MAVKINHELAFNLEDLKNLRTQTQNVLEDIREQRIDLKDGLNQLRKDWNTNAGRYFFENLDRDWDSQVQMFEHTLVIFEEVLTDAITQFEALLEQADALTIDLP